MKTSAVLVALTVGICLNLSAQSHYDNRQYTTSERTETGYIRTICPCEAAKFFSGAQNRFCNRPVIISQNCPQYTLGLSNNQASEGFSFADFFKRFKRKRKVTYSKGSHIIPLVQN
jgi:hypothetical protein